ncbi:hypothetical protein BV20DRAFT_969743 [Pilatotrama ljubarskyi]|nr:hypothetical protein BV20DRAFT_969743 [Pilatotrama ljubarskyi]
MTSHGTDVSWDSLGRTTLPASDSLSRKEYMRRELLPTTEIYPSPHGQTRDTLSPPRASKPTDPCGGNSFLDRHAIANYPSKAPEHPPSLSVYKRPTATFMWPRFTPKVAEPVSLRPVIYVKYRPPQEEPDRPASSSGTSTHGSQGSDHSNLTPYSTPASTPPPASRKRSSSIDSDIVASPSDRFLKHSRTSRHSPIHRVSSERTTACSEIVSHTSRPTERSLKTTCLTIGSEQSRPATYHSNSGYATALPRSAVPPAVNAYAARQASANQQDDPMKEEWMKYTTPHPDLSPSAPLYKCTWTIKTSGGTKECEYRSKKHLVKRHIESKHLQLRPCVCPVCGKGFAQKSNLDTHLNTHTGDEPHKCHYCQLRFKDPARRHRHMISAHGHISSRTKKGRQAPTTFSPEVSDPEA